MFKNPLSRKQNLVVQELEGEIMIYDLTENKAFCLNSTSAIVWQACDGNNSPQQISKIVTEKIGKKANEDLVWFALDQLKKEKLLENSEELASPFLGLTRREVIKKVGLGTMVGLPMVASIIAPTSLHAVTCSGVTGACSTTGDCCSTSPTSTCVSMLCCNGMGTVTNSPTPIPNPIGNCGNPSSVQTACDTNCCDAMASGSVTGCTGGPTGTIICSCS